MTEELKKYSIKKSNVGDWEIDIEYDPNNNTSLVKAKKMKEKKVVDTWESGIPDGMSADALDVWIATKCLGLPVDKTAVCPMCQGSGSVSGVGLNTVKVEVVE